MSILNRSTADDVTATQTEFVPAKQPLKPMRVVLHVFLITMAVAWLVPIGTAIYNSFRFYESDTQVNGPFSLPNSLTLENYQDAWRVGEMSKTFGNTAFIVIPSLILTLLLASMVGFACTRHASW